MEAGMRDYNGFFILPVPGLNQGQPIIFYNSFVSKPYMYSISLLSMIET